MIIKHFPMTSVKKSNFSGLVQYITDKQGKFERVGVCSITNCTGETIDDVVPEILAVQQLNTRATSDKTYHLLVSFRPGENPDAATLKAIEENICSGLGYDEHQRVSVVHHDTDNIHLHIAINKIHPTKLTMREPYNTYRTFAKLSKALEKEHGLEPDNHLSQKSISEGRANDMERHSGIESLMTWIRKECLQKIRDAQSWKELHQVLSENGLELLERGNGFVFKSNSGAMIKASTVARDISKTQLEKRLGLFQKSSENIKKPKQEYHKRPIKMRINTDELFLQYQKKTQEILNAKRLELKKIRTRKMKKIEDAQRSNRLHRATIKLMKGRFTKKLLYAKAYKNLHAKIRSINDDSNKERQVINDQFRCLTWLDWLKKEALSGNQEALNALRARMMAQGLKGNTIQGDGFHHDFKLPVVVDNVTKKGTLFIRTGKMIIRDDGEKVLTSREVTTENLQEALPLVIARYGNHIFINGTAGFKERIVQIAASSRLPLTFADETLEGRRQQLLYKKYYYDRGRPDQHKDAPVETGKRVSFDDTVIVTKGKIKTKGRSR